MSDIIHTKLYLFFLLFTINSFGQLEFNQTKIDSLFLNYPAGMPGMSYMVIKSGKIIENQNFGLANLTNKEKANNNTNYRLASVTKQFTAYAILMLINDGELSFSTTLTDIFDDFPKYGNLITIQQLLTHTSGLLDYENLMKEDRTNPILDDEVLQLMKQQDSTKFIPGSKYDYSNSAYAVLAQIVKKKTHKSYKEFIETVIFKPLKMNSSVVYTKDSEIKNRAYGYTIKNDSIVFSDQSMTSSVQGDGGIYTSLKDYFKWDNALEDNKLILSKLKNKAYSVQSINPASEWDYGYGWRIKFNGKTKIISHSGHTSGFTNYVVKIPSQKLAIVLFSNRKNDDTVIEIGNMLLQKFAN
ncbi:MAG: serine hydrolase [Flavobacteriaceae bacterium]|nr:serine hydrolase [Flavobacteriaceae bacterium]